MNTYINNIHFLLGCCP